MKTSYLFTFLMSLIICYGCTNKEHDFMPTEGVVVDPDDDGGILKTEFKCKNKESEWKVICTDGHIHEFVNYSSRLCLKTGQKVHFNHCTSNCRGVVIKDLQKIGKDLCEVCPKVE